jgi:hypothetical protein
MSCENQGALSTPETDLPEVLPSVDRSIDEEDKPGSRKRSWNSPNLPIAKNLLV